MDNANYLTGVTLYKGNSSEAVVLSAYVQAGFLVSLPFGGGSAYDLVVDTGMRLIRVQVKTGKLAEGYIVYNTRRHRGASSTRLAVTALTRLTPSLFIATAMANCTSFLPRTP